MLATVVTAIPVLMHTSGSYGYAFPQTPKEQSFPLPRYHLHRVTHRATSRASSRKGVTLNVTSLPLRLQPYSLQLAPPPFA